MAKKKEADVQNSIAHKVLLEPWITEEATRVGELNKYTFKVAVSADKGQIKRSVEDVFGIKVISVNVINMPRKKRIRGRVTGWKAGYKKAIVTIKEGDKIEFFEGK
jgi:large subunit ribosomal protein L23